MKTTVLLSALLLSCALPPAAARARSDAERHAERHAEAEALFHQSARALARNTVDTRRQAVRCLEEATLLLLQKAGFHFTVCSRSYFPAADDEELEGMLMRPPISYAP